VKVVPQVLLLLPAALVLVPAPVLVVALVLLQLRHPVLALAPLLGLDSR